MSDARRGAPVAPAAALAGTLFLAAPAAAQPEEVRISWVRGPGAHGCAGPARIVEQVTARLGHGAVAADGTRAIDVYVTRAGGTWRAQIYKRGRDDALSGTRELTSEAEDCAPIEAASVLAIALAIDPDAGTRPPSPPSPSLAPSPIPSPSPGASPRHPPTRSPVADDVLAPAPLPAWVPPPDPAQPSHPPPGGAGATLRAGVGVGLLPGVAASFLLASEVSVAPRVHVTGAALWMPEVRASDARFAFGLSAFSLGTCGDVAVWARVDLALCGALWGGALHGVVYTLTPVDPGQHAWAAAEAAARLRIHLVSRLHAELVLPAVVPLVRPPFTVTGFAAPVFRQAPVTFLPTAGLGAHFP